MLESIKPNVWRLKEDGRDVCIKSYEELTLYLNYEGSQTLIHGDIAHHNFLQTKSRLVIIDFDLASYADPDEEWTLLLQRFMPFANYDLQQLIDEHPDFLRIIEEQPSGLRYPNEVFREWLAFLQKPHKKKQERLLAFTAKALENHRKLWYDA